MRTKQAKAQRITKPRWEHSSEVRYVRKVVSDAIEQITLQKGRLILPQRGELPLLSWFDQIYDMPNVISLEIMVGETEIHGIRKVDKELEHRLISLIRGRHKGHALRTTFKERVRIVMVLG